jgi:hypothetical protein
MKKIKAAQKQLDRALANLDRAANYLEESGLAPQSHILDGAADRVEDLRGNVGSIVARYPPPLPEAC